jgi:hypothetical protein
LKKKIHDLLNEAAASGELSRDLATAAVELFKLEGNEAMLACRLLGGGADPASLEYLADARVSEKIELAHRNGPSVYKLGDPDLQHYLTLCGLSEDEADDSNLRGRVLRYAESLKYLGALGPDGAWSEHQLADAAEDASLAYTSLPYAEVYLDGVNVRCYTSDGGHAAAVWDGDDPQTASCVFGIFNGEPYLALAAPIHAPPLVRQGFADTLAEKQLSERFWIVTNPGVVAAVSDLLVKSGMLEESK